MSPSAAVAKRRANGRHSEVDNVGDESRKPYKDRRRDRQKRRDYPFRTGHAMTVLAIGRYRGTSVQWCGR